MCVCVYPKCAVEEYQRGLQTLMGWGSGAPEAQRTPRTLCEKVFGPKNPLKRVLGALGGVVLGFEFKFLRFGFWALGFRRFQQGL